MCALWGQVQISTHLPKHRPPPSPTHKLTHITVLWINDGDGGGDDGDGMVMMEIMVVMVTHWNSDDELNISLKPGAVCKPRR